MARVFIGIPTLNRPEWVRETVGSVLAQTFGDFRVVVSDNCSAPEAARSVRDWVEALGDARVSFHQQPENRFEYGQGRYFFREAREEFFVILHDDDLLEPEYLARAVAALEARPAIAFFMANPYVFDENGARWPERTEAYLREHGRKARDEGEFEVLRTLLESGFAPISGTCFRLEALRASGFVDDDCEGNYPFEVNVLLRLGERGARAWYCPEELMGFRFHRNSLRVYGGVLENPRVVGTMTTLLERRRFAGWNERRRRQILGKLHRRAALRLVREGDEAGCRTRLLKAAAANPFSLRLWASMPLAFLAPGLLRSVLPPLVETREAPRGTGLGASSAVLLLLLPLLAACASARAKGVLVVAPETVQSAARYQKEYVLAPDDQIDVVVQRAPEASRNVLIRPDGYISLPLLGDVQAAGLTPRELTARLNELFGKRLIDPEVVVIATRVRPATVYVLGEVGAPVAVALRDAPTAMQAITLAGGFRRSASDKNVAIIRLSPEGRLQAIPIPTRVGGQPGRYMALRVARLQPDDLVFVPENSRSQFSRFVDDIINKPLSGINSLASPLINYRLFQVLGEQN